MEELNFSRFRVEGFLGTIWLKNPPMNLLTEEMKEELLQILNRMEAEDKVRVVILTGEGDKAFCAGRDLNQTRSWQVSPRLPLGEVWDRGNRLIDCILFYPRVTIAALNGLALGGGCELTLPFDFVVAEKTVKIGLPEATRGIFPGTGAMKLLPKKIGLFKARELVFWGKILSAEEALSWGLVNVISEKKALDAAYDYAQKLNQVSFQAILRAKKIMNQHEFWPGSASMHLEREEFSRIFHTPDAREGVSAFFEKRSPLFNRDLNYKDDQGGKKE